MESSESLEEKSPEIFNFNPAKGRLFVWKVALLWSKWAAQADLRVLVKHGTKHQSLITLSAFVLPQNCRHYWPAVQTFVKGKQKAYKKGAGKKKHLLQDCSVFHLWKTNRGCCRGGRILHLKLEISPTVEALGEIRWVCVKAGNESSQQERRRECQTERGRHIGSRQEVHLKLICYSKKERRGSKSSRHSWKHQKTSGNQGASSSPRLLLGLIPLCIDAPRLMVKSISSGWKCHLA